MIKRLRENTKSVMKKYKGIQYEQLTKNQINNLYRRFIM